MDRKILLRISCVLFLITLFSCKPEEAYTTYGNPQWKVEDYMDFSVSCTYVISLPENLKPYQTGEDVFAAFIDGECRGVSLQENGLFYLMVMAPSEETGYVVLKYWNAMTCYMYQVNEVIPFETDKMVGTSDEPFVPTLTNL